MLSLLHIENIATIESADIEFGCGFNVLTGETGAGKSIVIDAIGAVMGERTSRDLIRTGAKSARVSAVFVQLPELAWFAENGMGPDEDGVLLLERVIQEDGKNICRLNGRPVTVAQLRSLGNQLLNIHGQHDGQQLLDSRYHILYLDRFGGLEKLTQAFGEAYQTAAALQREISALQMDEAEKARRTDALTYQIGELERAELKLGEDEELDARRQLLRNAGKLIDGAERACYALSGGEDSPGAVALIGDAEAQIRALSRVSGELSDLSQQLAELYSSAYDIAERVRDFRDQFDFSPEELEQLERRLDQIYRLKKKYGSTVEEMLAFLERCRQELASLQSSDDEVIRLTQKLESLIAKATEQGKCLTEKRRAAAQSLQARIQEELAQLDMPRVRFMVELTPKPDGAMDETGMDDVEFLMSANVGEAAKAIQKIASGGELARIMLALKNVLAENDDVTTLIFDEVDTGVSGRAAQKVAEKMAQVAGKKQVLCVTHLPQIAAMADHHFSVEKHIEKDRTFTQVVPLSAERRKEELARLTGGAVVTQTMLDSAGELLEAADRWKREKRA